MDIFYGYPSIELLISINRIMEIYNRVMEIQNQS